MLDTNGTIQKKHALLNGKYYKVANQAFYDAGFSSACRTALQDSRRHACGRQRTFADRFQTHQSALLPAHRALPRPHRRADGAEHFLQRKRACRLPA